MSDDREYTITVTVISARSEYAQALRNEIVSNLESVEKTCPGDYDYRVGEVTENKTI